MEQIFLYSSDIFSMIIEIDNCFAVLLLMHISKSSLIINIVISR